MSVFSGPNIVKDNLIFYLDPENLKSLKFKTRLYNYSVWQNGQTGSIGDFTQYSSNNARILVADPWGNTVTGWKAYSVLNSTNGGGIYMNYKTIDNTKMYRMSWWEKRVTNSTTTYSRYYAGLNGSPVAVRNRNNDALNTNPYFYNTSNIPSSTQLPENTWVLVVGHVWPAGSGIGINYEDSGRYTISRGRLGNITYDFIFDAATTSVRSRTLAVYAASTPQNTNDVLHYTVYPRLDMCDGTEPSIDDLLNNRTDTLYNLSNDFNVTMINGPYFDVDGIRFTGPNRTSPQTLESISSKWIQIFNSDNNFSISLWFNPTLSATYNQTLLSQVHGEGVSLILMTNNKVTFELGQTDTYEGTNTTFENNKWYNITVTYVNNGRDSYCVYYVNGLFDKQENKGGGSMLTNDILTIGHQTENYGINPIDYGGKIGIVKIYTKALTAFEVLQNYNAIKQRYI